MSVSFPSKKWDEDVEENFFRELINSFKYKLEDAEEIANYLRKYERKIDELSRFIFGLFFLSPYVRTLPITVHYKKSVDEIDKYNINERGAYTNEELGIFAGVIDGNKVSGFFSLSQEYGNPMRRLEKILEDCRVIKIEFF